MTRKQTNINSFAGQLALIEYKAREFRTVVIDPNGMGEKAATMGVNLSDAAEMTGLRKEFLLGMVQDGNFLETPVCNYISVINKSENSGFPSLEQIWIEFSDLVDLVVECVQYCPDLKPRPLLDFLSWWAKEGMYLRYIVSVEDWQEDSLAVFVSNKKQLFSEGYSQETKPLSSTAKGWIYFILDQKSNAVKIGFTADKSGDRLSGVQVGNPNPLSVIKSINGTMRQEKELQAQFAHLKMIGEWFEATDELRQFINEVR